MLRIFRGTGPGVILLMVLTLALLWISAFIDPQVSSAAIYDTSPMPLYSALKFLIGKSPVTGVIFSFVILCLILFLLVNFNTSQFFINERTFLPATLYILFSALFPHCQAFNPVLPAVVFLMLAIRRIMDSYRKPDIAYNFFDAGILISIGSLFYADMIWFGILVIAGIALIRTGNITEIGITIFGLITPYLILTGFYFVLGKDLTLFYSDIRQNLFGESSGYIISRLTLVAIIYAGLILILSIAFLLRGMNSKKIKARKTFSVLLWGFFISLIIYFALPSVSFEMIWITAVPASYILAHYFVFAKKKILPEIIFSGFFLLILLVQVFRIF